MSWCALLFLAIIGLEGRRLVFLFILWPLEFDSLCELSEWREKLDSSGDSIEEWSATIATWSWSDYSELAGAH